MSVLPNFTSEGRLPAGDYELTFDELRQSPLVVGPSERLSWDADWRTHLVNNLQVLVRQLWMVGITEIFIDGSFVEDKDHPNDIDGYFVCDVHRFVSGTLQNELNRLDPYQIWTWDSNRCRPSPDSAVQRLPMWHQYHVELYPHYGQGSGIYDRHGNELKFPAAFRSVRGRGKQRGIIKIGGRS